MKYTSIKICLVIIALFGGVAGASETVTYDCKTPETKGYWKNHPVPGKDMTIRFFNSGKDVEVILNPEGYRYKGNVISYSSKRKELKFRNEDNMVANKLDLYLIYGYISAGKIIVVKRFF